MTQPELPNRYSTRALLGEGGSGRVYHVRDSLRSRDLALKLVTPAENAFLRREFETLRQIRHENVIQVFDWGSLQSGEAYYTMELVEGEDWGRSMGGPQSDGEVRRILTGLLRGLAHLHCHGEIHGDLKPGNVLLGRSGQVIVTDVGMGGSGGKAPGVSGTPGYAAPEVWEGKPANERSDLYSVGVMAYEALTGRHPFGGKTIREVVAGQMEGWVPSPGAHGVPVAQDVERVVMRALERDPSLRQGTADEWMEALGVRDCVGQILNGRFVDREEALSAVPLDSRSGNHELTLICFYGEERVGRLSVLEEIAQAVLSVGGTVVRATMSDLYNVCTLATLAANQLSGFDSSSTDLIRASMSFEELADALLIRAHSSPIIIVIDGRFAGDRDLLGELRRFARTLRARGERSPAGTVGSVRVLAALGLEPRSPEAQERFVRLEPFDKDTLTRQLNGLLGKSDLPAALSERLHSITRGIPGLVSIATLELIETAVLQRKEGRWRYDEGHPVESLRLASLSDPMGQLWRRTPKSMRPLLATVSLLRSGGGSRVLSVGVEGDIVAALTHLTHLGWLRRIGETWTIAAPQFRAFVLEAVGADGTRRAAKALLARKDVELPAEDRGDLLLIAGSGSQVWEFGLKSAQIASERGEHQLVLERTALLTSRHDHEMPIELRATVALLRAHSMNQVGLDNEAADLLLDSSIWESSQVTDRAKIQRSRQLGVIYRTIGYVEKAKEWLQRAVELSEALGDAKEYLQTVAELTQLEWEHGTEVERQRAIAMIRAALLGSPAGEGVEEERAALTYGLGAALIWNGDRAGAKAALLEGLGIRCSEYWKMRLANALSSATMYLGELEESIRWSHEAWTHAERSGTDGFRARILANRGATLHALGRLRESADVDMAAAEWGQRTGNPYEYEAGIAGAAINLLLLARYEEALMRASEAHVAAERARNERHIAKGLELRALAHFFIGEVDEAERLVKLGQNALESHEYLDTKPRLDWLDARIAIERGDLEGGYRKLVRVEEGLQKIRDLEDLWGVQVELYLVRGRLEHDSGVVQVLSRVVAEARSAGIRLAWIGGALALSEIVSDLDLDDREARAVIRDGLAMAEECGMLELSWQLAYRIGVLARRKGDLRETQARFTHAIRIVKEIASHLTPPHRATYMQSRRVRTALEAMSLRS